MFRFALVFFIVAAAVASASAKQVKKTRRNHESCQEEGHPFDQCQILFITGSEYSTVKAIQQAPNVTEAKKLLKEDDSFENLCSEGKSLLQCYISSYERASEGCRDRFKDDIPRVEGTLSFLDDICNEDNIAIARENLDCLANENELRTLHHCIYENFNIDCSEDTAQHGSIGDCWDKKFSANCDTEEVVKCAVEKLAEPCGQDSEKLIHLIGTKYLQTFPTCPGGPSFAKLLKFFKK